MLSESQRQRLMYLHAYEWAGESDEESDAALDTWFEAVQSERELWYSAWILPWDVSNGQLDRVIQHPMCSRALALLLYWLLGPGEIRAKEERDGALSEWESGVVSTLDGLERRLLRGEFPQGSIGFSPVVFLGTRRTRLVKHVPEELLHEVPGTVVPYDSLEEVFGSV